MVSPASSGVSCVFRGGEGQQFVVHQLRVPRLCLSVLSTWKIAEQILTLGLHRFKESFFFLLQRALQDLCVCVCSSVSECSVSSPDTDHNNRTSNSQTLSSACSTVICTVYVSVCTVSLWANVLISLCSIPMHTNGTSDQYARWRIRKRVGAE